MAEQVDTGWNGRLWNIEYHAQACREMLHEVREIVRALPDRWVIQAAPDAPTWVQERVRAIPLHERRYALRYEAEHAGAILEADLSFAGAPKGCIQLRWLEMAGDATNVRGIR